MKGFTDLIGIINWFKDFLGDGYTTVIFKLIKDAIHEYSDDGELTKAEIAEVLGKSLLLWAEEQGEPLDD